MKTQASNTGKNPFDQQAEIPGVKYIIAIGSGKGGVGKSTVALNLALAFKKKSTTLKVGLLDADLYGPSLPRMMGCLNQKTDINSENKKVIPLNRFGIKLMSMGFLVKEDLPVIWRGPMLFKAIGQFLNEVDWGELDYLIVDLPPGTGDVVLTLAQKTPVSGGIVVCTPQNIALADAKKALNMLAHLKIPCLGVVENMSSFKVRQDEEPIDLFPKGQLDIYLKTNNIKKLSSIPFHPDVGLSCESGVPFMESYPDSEEGLSFLELADHILEKYTNKIQQ